jgi:hypothetical protein
MQPFLFFITRKENYMTTQTITHTTPTAAPTWLRRILRGNALFCAACGVDALIGGQWLATFMGIPAVALLVLGIGLVAYGLILWRLVEIPTRAIVQFVTALDVGWIVGSMVLLFVPIVPLTDMGKIIIDVVALITAGFAIAQYMGLRRM